jgi:hypothetical protein
MKTFNKDGLRFIIGTLVAAVTAVLVASIISTSLGTLAEAIRESNGNSSANSLSGSSSLSGSNSSNTTSSSPNSVINEVHQITFNTAGGTAVTPSTLQIPHGEFILNFPATTLTNNTFLGWYTGVTPNDVLFTGTMPVVQDMTLFARWQQIVEIPVGEPGAVTWRVAFNATGGSTVDHVQVDDGRTMQLPVTTRVGYVFLGWFTGDLPGDVQFTASTIVVRDMDLVARWERESFMITFLTYGGSFVAPMTAKAEAPISAPINPTRQNFSFGGWFTTVDYTTEFVFDKMPDDSITLHALWTPGTFEGLRYTCSTTECIITGYEGVHSSIYIPAEIDELPVTMVADRAFEGNENLVSITFEDGEGSSSYVKTIGTSAFANMATLRDLTLPQSALETIKNDAFKNSSLLTAVDIPSGVTTLGTNVLTGTDSIERITVRPGNNSKSVATFNFRYLFGGGTVFNSAVNVPLSLETVIVSEGETTIPSDFLRDLPMITEVVMPKSITTMGTAVLLGANKLNKLTWTFTSSVDGAANSFLSFAFNNTHTVVTNVPTTLENVTINKTTLTKIGSYAFYNIASLTQINLPNNITELGTHGFAHAAVNTSKIKEISLPSSLLAIPANLFLNNSSVTDIELPENLVTIGASAFQNTTSLDEIEIPNTVTTIGANILTGSNSLEKLTYSNNSLPANTRYLRYFFGGTSVTAGVVPQSLKTVEITTGDALVASYFESITTIETIFLPSTIATINNRAFFGMTALRQVAVLGSIPTPDRVVLPSALTTLGTSVFQNAASIRHVTIPAAITQMPVDTFNGATELTTVVTGTSMTVIGDRAFQSTKLTTFTFANNLTTIGVNAFQGTLLTQVVVPNTVVSIGNDAFRSMSALTTITFPSTVPAVAPLFTLGTNVLTGAQVLTTINFHIDMLPTLASNRVLRYFFGGSTTVVGTIPTTLTTVNLTGGTVLSGQFFQNLTGLINVTLPSTLIEIGTLAFDGVTGITALTIPQSVNSIGASAFRAMTGLARLTFLRETLAATLGTTLFATSAASAVILDNLFIVVPTEEALTAYIVNAQFAAFNTVTPIRIVVATPAV